LGGGSRHRGIHREVSRAGSGNFGVTYIRQQDSPERVKMLLRIADFFASRKK